MARRQLAALVLSGAERAELTSLAARRSTAQALALRARIVLGCAEGAQRVRRITMSRHVFRSTGRR
jgi:hypothetical protein